LSKVSADEVFVHYFQHMPSASFVYPAGPPSLDFAGGLPCLYL